MKIMMFEVWTQWISFGFGHGLEKIFWHYDRNVPKIRFLKWYEDDKSENLPLVVLEYSMLYF